MVAGAAAAVALVALLRDTRYQGQDFEVFYGAARALLDGRPLYDLARGDGMVFKYPPWAIVVFFPFAWLPLAWAKWLWGGVGVASLAYVVQWVLARGADRRAAAATAALFWGIWAVHALDGQVVLPMLAVALATGASRGAAAGAALALALSTKVFTGLALLGSGIARRPWGAAALAAAAAAALSVPAVVRQPVGGVSGLIADWQTAARSGGERLSEGKIRGRENQGLPALILRATGVPAHDQRTELLTAVVVAFLLAAAWTALSRGMAADRRWAGWLAVAAVAHPLAWFHLFALVFPLAALTVSDALRSGGRVRLAAAAVGAILVAAVTRKTLGPLGAALELASVKSWGTLILLGVSARTLPGKFDSRQVLERVKPV